MKDGISATNGAANEAAEVVSEIGAEGVPLEEMVQAEGLREVDQGEVGVVAYGELAFVGEAVALCGLRREQLGDALEG